MFGNKLVQLRGCCFKRTSDVCRAGIELGQLGQVGLLTTPVQAVCTHESKYMAFLPPKVTLSPFNPSTIAETVQPEKSGLSHPSSSPPPLQMAPILWAHSLHLFMYLYSPHFPFLQQLFLKYPL